MWLENQPGSRSYMGSVPTQRFCSALSEKIYYQRFHFRMKLYGHKTWFELKIHGHQLWLEKKIGNTNHELKLNYADTNHDARLCLRVTVIVLISASSFKQLIPANNSELKRVSRLIDRHCLQLTCLLIHPHSSSCIFIHPC